jgi:hypothetical protein
MLSGFWAKFFRESYAMGKQRLRKEGWTEQIIKLWPFIAPWLKDDQMSTYFTSWWKFDSGMLLIQTTLSIGNETHNQALGLKQILKADKTCEGRGCRKDHTFVVSCVQRSVLFPPCPYCHKRYQSDLPQGPVRKGVSANQGHPPSSAIA